MDILALFRTIPTSSSWINSTSTQTLITTDYTAFELVQTLIEQTSWGIRSAMNQIDSTPSDIISIVSTISQQALPPLSSVPGACAVQAASVSLFYWQKKVTTSRYCGSNGGSSEMTTLLPTGPSTLLTTLDSTPIIMSSPSVYLYLTDMTFESVGERWTSTEVKTNAIISMPPESLRSVEFHLSGFPQNAWQSEVELRYSENPVNWPQYNRCNGTSATWYLTATGKEFNLLNLQTAVPASEYFAAQTDIVDTTIRDYHAYIEAPSDIWKLPGMASWKEPDCSVIVAGWHDPPTALNTVSSEAIITPASTIHKSTQSAAPASAPMPAPVRTDPPVPTPTTATPEDIAATIVGAIGQESGPENRPSDSNGNLQADTQGPGPQGRPGGNNGNSQASSQVPGISQSQAAGLAGSNIGLQVPPKGQVNDPSRVGPNTASGNNANWQAGAQGPEPEDKPGDNNGNLQASSQVSGISQSQAAGLAGSNNGL